LNSEKGSTLDPQQLRMRYWWVNQNKTYRHEVPGGYLWSPRRKKNGSINPFYETMREVAPGDLIFSFADTFIRAFGIARSYAYEAPKPSAFGAAGRDWDDIGWRVDVAFQEITSSFRPSDWMTRLEPLLPRRYSPLLKDGRGVQSIYLAELPSALALEIADLIDGELSAIARTSYMPGAVLGDLAAPSAEAALWEEHIRKSIEDDHDLEETEKSAIVLARRGQGLFKERVQRIESRCRITHVDNPTHLRASHCKPWRLATNAERLSGDNGLLLTPSIDHLFDRGFISFRDDGRLLVSPIADKQSLTRMGIVVGREVDVGRFTAGQAKFLEFHRDQVFHRANRRAG
jgi:HNH endonuclease